ncbi:MAG: hypothetical protein QOH47_2011 [Sphingomonadales bacterium]|jgi:hypothetical protein|nr:hypothetical protein [Sphingomonadales bacterium]
MKRMILALALFAAPASAQTAQPAQSTPPPSAPAAPLDYSAADLWLCLPGRADACAAPLATAELEPNGYGAVTTPTPAADPPIDCFYVYPTVSRDPTPNSDTIPGRTEEIGATIVQFGRFATICRPYAPVYRSATLSMIPRARAGENVAPLFDLAYRDVRAAWLYYLDHYNRGRPVVLIGHSQGTIHLTRLLAEEIENRPAAARLLSALLIGFAVEVPEGQVVGGTLRRTPLCTRAGETGCVVTYMSFRAAAPPPPGALMGRAVRPGMTAGCVNPAALAGGSARLDSYWFAMPSQMGGPPTIWSSTGPAPTPFLHTNGLISGECRHDGPAGWLAISVNADPADARTDDVPGDVPIPGWGMHLGDVGYAQGDLIRLVAAQRDAWLRARR